ncbi:MAG TPA: hypothetical protein DEF61_01295 [Firmicutes bacterium]|nr:hypothetical protein [Bacillota bacterium]
MITISFLGLDQFVVGRYSKEHTKALASLFETSEDEINFYAPNSMVFHNGVEQTSWNLIVIVKAPTKYKPLEKVVAKYLLETLPLFSIHIELEFEYFETSSRYEKINPDYPRYIDQGHIKEVDVTFDNDDGCLDECCHGRDDANPNDRADLDYNDPNQIYLGNAFEDFDKKLEKAKKESK